MFRRRTNIYSYSHWRYISLRCKDRPYGHPFSQMRICIYTRLQPSQNSMKQALRAYTASCFQLCVPGIALTYPTGRGDSAKAISCCNALLSNSLRLT